MIRRDLWVWVGLLIVTTLGLAAWIIVSRPSATEVSQASQTLPPLGVSRLSDQTFNMLGNRQTNGTIPVTPAPTDSARSDPFHQ